jgi:peroxiredoxin Q/BCP
MKSMYGKQIRGIERSTFLIDPHGILRHEWRKVSVPEHIPAVLAQLKQLTA